MLIVLIVMTGLMAGIYFAFSVFVMKSLALLPDKDGAIAMNKINEVIVNTVFLPLFFVSSLGHVGLLIWAPFYLEGFKFWIIIAAGLLYIFGMFVTTVVGNVPLNNQLKNAESNDDMLILTWQNYLKKWTVYNHIRTVGCSISMALLVVYFAM